MCSYRADEREVVVLVGAIYATLNYSLPDARVLIAGILSTIAQRGALQLICRQEKNERATEGERNIDVVVDDDVNPNSAATLT